MHRDLKSLVILAPITALQKEILDIASPLNFLKSRYNLEIIDPLEGVTSDMSAESFYYSWREKIKYMSDNCAGFIGFSFGGVILQRCFSMFAKNKKLIILFSTPSFINEDLYKKLNAVRDKVKDEGLTAAIKFLNSQVLYPSCKVFEPEDYEGLYQLASLRIVKGIEFILNIDMKNHISDNMVDYINFIGEESALVNKGNVCQGPLGQVDFVPGAGMRVLSDNLDHCEKRIEEYILK
jgi:hypothetical protein